MSIGGLFLVFQVTGPATQNDCMPSRCLVHGTTRSQWAAEHRAACAVTEDTCTRSSYSSEKSNVFK